MVAARRGRADHRHRGPAVGRRIVARAGVAAAAPDDHLGARPDGCDADGRLGQRGGGRPGVTGAATELRQAPSGPVLRRRRRCVPELRIESGQPLVERGAGVATAESFVGLEVGAREPLGEQRARQALGQEIAVGFERLDEVVELLRFAGVAEDAAELGAEVGGAHGSRPEAFERSRQAERLFDVALDRLQGQNRRERRLRGGVRRRPDPVLPAELLDGLPAGDPLVEVERLASPGGRCPEDDDGESEECRTPAIDEESILGSSHGFLRAAARGLGGLAGQ